VKTVVAVYSFKRTNLKVERRDKP